MKELLLTLTILHGGDSITTGLNHGAGIRESNPLLPKNPYAALTVKSAEAVTTIKLLEKLAEHKPRLARWLTVGAIVAEGTAIGLNVNARVGQVRR